MSTLNIQLLCRKSEKVPYIIAICFLGTMINPRLIEQTMSRTDFHSPKDVRAIEVRLYVKLSTTCRAQLFKANDIVS